MLAGAQLVLVAAEKHHAVGAAINGVLFLAAAIRPWSWSKRRAEQGRAPEARFWRRLVSQTLGWIGVFFLFFAPSPNAAHVVFWVALVAIGVQIVRHVAPPSRSVPLSDRERRVVVAILLWSATRAVITQFVRSDDGPVLVPLVVFAVLDGCLWVLVARRSRWAKWLATPSVVLGLPLGIWWLVMLEPRGLLVVGDAAACLLLVRTRLESVGRSSPATSPSTDGPLA